MIEIVWNPKNEIKDWVCSQMKQHAEVDEPYSAFAAIKKDSENPNGKIVGGVIFHDMRILPHGMEVEMSVAGVQGELWLTPRTIRTAMVFVFWKLNCVRLVVHVHQDNKASINIIEKFGFVDEGVLRDRAGPGIDVFRYSMLRHECEAYKKAIERAERAVAEMPKN